MRTYCCLSGAAMDCLASECVECSGLGPHRDVLVDICGHQVGCGSHGHHCELAPSHKGKCAAPTALEQCGTRRTHKR